MRAEPAAAQSVQPQPQAGITAQELSELQGLKLRDLRKRAQAAGVNRDDLEDAMDELDPETAVIELIMQAGAAAAAAEAAAPAPVVAARDRTPVARAPVEPALHYPTASPKRPSMRINIDPDAMTDSAIASALGGADSAGGGADLPIDAVELTSKPSMKIVIDPEAMTDAAIAGALGGADPEGGAGDLPIDAQETPK
jgi:hypothetical protein